MEDENYSLDDQDFGLDENVDDFNDNNLELDLENIFYDETKVYFLKSDGTFNILTVNSEDQAKKIVDVIKEDAETTTDAQ